MTRQTSTWKCKPNLVSLIEMYNKQVDWNGRIKNILQERCYIYKICHVLNALFTVT